MIEERADSRTPGDRHGLQDESAAFRRVADPAAGDNARLVVPLDAQLTLEQPRFPVGRMAFRRALRALSPLPLREVAWTAPFPEAQGGGECVILVRNAFLDRQSRTMSRKEQLRLLVLTCSGQRVCYTPPAARRRLALTLVIAIISAIVVLTMILAVLAKQASAPVPEAGAVSSLRPMFERPGILATIEQAAREVPEGAILSAVAVEGEDSLAIEFAVQDPDVFRQIMRPYARELRQSRLESGGYRMTFAIPFAEWDQSAGQASVLQAENAGQAAQRVTQLLRELAREEVLQIVVAGGKNSEEILTMGIRVAGTQASVLSFANRIESGQPAMRFVDWRVENHPAGAALSGELLVPWGAAP